MAEPVGTQTILSIQNVCKSFPGVRALDNVSIEVQKGTIHGIVGENGAGKSTLMKILSGVYHKDSGRIVFDHAEMENIKPIEALQRGLSIIYQEFNLINAMSVGENIFLGRFRESGGMRGTHKKAGEILKQIGSKIDTHTPVGELSVSEKQMVEIAKALSFDAKLIIMDEPSTSLTNEEMEHLTEIIHTLKEKGISIIYISHKLEEIFSFCDTVTIMRDGQVIDTKPVSELSRREMIAKMIGRQIENEFPPRSEKIGNVIFEVQGLNTNKLHDISFNIRQGEILGLVGLVGSGRTEIARAIFGADKVKGHAVQMDGKPIQVRNVIEAKQHGIGLVPEDRKQQGLVLFFPVEENISMASLDRIRDHGFVNHAKEREIAKRQVDSLHIKTPDLRTKTVSLSGGNQQKCIVGRWMELNPRILILDEPTKGIDVGAKYEIYLLMKQIAENGGAILLISSELPEVLNMSNRVLTICEGRITGEFDPAETSADEIMEKTLGL